jgi:hypothetical protein
MENVTLREFVERILLEHDKAHEAQHEAVGIASRELERRLEVLNHAHERSVEDRSQFVTKEVVDGLLAASLERYETMKREQVTRAEALAAADDLLAKAVNERITPLESFRAKAGFIAGGLVVIGGILGATIVKVLGG